MLIRSKISIPIRKLIKTTRLWQDNQIIFREFKHFRIIAITALVCTLLAAVFEGATIGLIASFLQVLSTPEKPPIKTGIELVDTIFLATRASSAARVYRLSALIIVAVWLKSFLQYLGLYYSTLAQSNLCDRLRKRLFEQFQSMSLSYYSSSSSGDLINSLTTEINQIKQAFGVFSTLITRGSTLIAYVVSMFWLSWTLSLVAILLYYLLSVGLTSFIGRVREASFHVPQANGHLTSIAIQFINGIRTIKGSATEDFEKTFLHQLMETRGDRTDFGIIDTNLQPTPAYYAIKNLISLLGEATWDRQTQAWDYPNVKTDSLKYTLQGDLKDLKHLLLQKSNGTFYLLIWQEVYSYDHRLNQDLINPDRIVEFQLDDAIIKKAKTYRVFNKTEPSATLSPLKTWNDVSNLSLYVPDHILVLEFTASTKG